LKIKQINYRSAIKSSRILYRLTFCMLTLINFLPYRLLNSYIKNLVLSSGVSVDQYSYLHHKIIYLIPNLGPGGSERQLVNLVNNLTNDSLQNKNNISKIIIICFNLRGDMNDFYVSQLNPAIELIDISAKCRTHLFLKPNVFNIKFFWLGKKLIYLNRIKEIIKLEKPTVFHAWLDSPAVCGGIAAISRSVPRVILSSRSLNPKYFLANRFYLKSVYQALSKFSQVTFLNNSLAGAKSYEDWLGFKPGYIEVIPNGFDLHEFKSLRVQKESKDDHACKIIGGVMRFSHEKNLNLWISSAFLLVKMGIPVKFILIGDGPDRWKVQKKINDMNLSNIFELINPQINVYNSISKFDVLLLTSQYEGLPNVLIEAQLLGIPVVATNVGGTVETFSDEISGISVENNNAYKIANSLYRLISDSKTYFKFSENAVIQSNARFGIDDISHKYLNIYNKV
jgi:glycosyltransferase involved in cell wall biosynthesis